ncbi:MAG: hypothetical protein WC663_02800 [Patescibacteria group bacterium]
MLKLTPKLEQALISTLILTLKRTLKSERLMKIRRLIQMPTLLPMSSLMKATMLVMTLSLMSRLTMEPISVLMSVKMFLVFPQPKSVMALTMTAIAILTKISTI